MQEKLMSAWTNSLKGKTKDSSFEKPEPSFDMNNLIETKLFVSHEGFCSLLQKCLLSSVAF